MPSINFLEQRKKIRKLVPILAIIVLITLLNFGSSFWSKRKPEALPGQIIVRPVGAEIDWKILESPLLDNLTLFPEIPPLDREAGRSNPFVPY